MIGVDEMLTTRAVKKSGIPHELVVTRDGAGALEYLMGGERDRLPDLVLLGLNLLKVTGLEFLVKLRVKPLCRPVPLVVLSSSMTREDVTAAYNPGCNSYIAKGINFSQFTEAAECLMRYWLVLNLTSGER
jgi:CheY-like chemotaxis protein